MSELKGREFTSVAVDEYAEFRDAAPPQNVMDEVKAGVKLLLSYEADVARAELELTMAKERRNRQKYEDLPLTMKKLGSLAEFVMEMDDGSLYTVTREEKVSAKLSEGNGPLVFKWMKEHGYAHHISNDLVVPFTKGQEAELHKLEEYLKKFNDGKVQYSTEDSIHSSTYTAFCTRLKKEKGEAVDDKMFGIHVVNQVSVKPVKSK